MAEQTQPLAGNGRHPSPNPFLFIVGCPRSGTTLVRRLVDAHPQVAVVNETHWIPKWYEKRTGLTPDGLVTAAVVENLCARPRFEKRFRIERDELEQLVAGEAVSYQAFVSYLFDRYAAARGKRLAGDKNPGYAKRLALLHELWPQARFVHLIRDGRDVALSAVNWHKSERLKRRFPTWAEQPFATAALWWEWHVRLGREGGAALGSPLYCELRYEALVADPALECARLCEFLGLPYDGAMVRFHEGKSKDDPALDAKHGWRPVTAGLRDWRSQMSPDEIEAFEAVAGGLLDELGYERAVPYPAAEALERVAALRAEFGTNAESRVFALPERWG